MANGDYISAWGLTSRTLPSAVSDQNYGPMRVSRRGELMTQDLDRKALADEGTYFIAHNVTNDASTTLAGHPAPVLADVTTFTKPLIVFRHTGGSTSQIRAYLDYIEIEVVTAGALGTSANWAAQLDTGASRYSSGTVETLTTVNPNMQSATTPLLDVKAGPYVATSPSSAARNVGFGQIRAAIEFAGDRTMFLFGGAPNVGANVVAGAASRHTVTMPPIVLGPTDSFLLALYAPSQNAAGVYKVRCAWTER